MSCAEAAEHYQVSHSSAIRWTKRQAEMGSPAALPMGGKKPFALAGEEAWIRERASEQDRASRGGGGNGRSGRARFVQPV